MLVYGWRGEEAGDEGSDGVETPSNEDGGRREGVRLGMDGGRKAGDG